MVLLSICLNEKKYHVYYTFFVIIVLLYFSGFAVRYYLERYTYTYASHVPLLMQGISYVLLVLNFTIT